MCLQPDKLRYGTHVNHGMPSCKEIPAQIFMLRWTRPIREANNGQMTDLIG